MNNTRIRQIKVGALFQVFSHSALIVFEIKVFLEFLIVLVLDNWNSRIFV